MEKTSLNHLSILQNIKIMIIMKKYLTGLTGFDILLLKIYQINSRR